eukprot:CAMPEP_0172460200 /NCGR_PEP_ID=MMETSP1065-20121228/35838_1 /TAXON_ID=265537 /ORGANISM="Amphiprora paludosa, Strain CCMP125" /LENGTH=60 /DNA_ID=CAMNT_0013215153 /DNA_START=609 /DNA_END=791 /DNA_ORIENTATION=+
MSVVRQQSPHCGLSMRSESDNGRPCFNMPPRKPASCPTRGFRTSWNQETVKDMKPALVCN